MMHGFIFVFSVWFVRLGIAGSRCGHLKPDPSWITIIQVRNNIYSKFAIFQNTIDRARTLTLIAVNVYFMIFTLDLWNVQAEDGMKWAIQFENTDIQTAVDHLHKTVGTNQVTRIKLCSTTAVASMDLWTTT